MTTADPAWADLQTLDDAALVTALRARMLEINTEPPERRADALAGVLVSEASLTDVQLRRFTTARYRAWLEMPPTEVQAFAASLDQARDRAPIASAMRSTSVDQSAAHNLSEAECLRLLDLAPSFAAALPQTVRDTMETVSRRDRDAARSLEHPGGRRSWKFWQR